MCAKPGINDVAGEPVRRGLAAGLLLDEFHGVSQLSFVRGLSLAGDVAAVDGEGDADDETDVVGEGEDLLARVRVARPMPEPAPVTKAALPVTAALLTVMCTPLACRRVVGFVRRHRRPPDNGCKASHAEVEAV